MLDHSQWQKGWTCNEKETELRKKAKNWQVALTNMAPPKIVPTKKKKKKKAYTKDTATVRNSKFWGHPSYIYEYEVAERMCKSEETHYTYTVNHHHQQRYLHGKIEEEK